MSPYPRDFQIGDRVEKVSGYKWPGVVVAAFYTLEMRPRFVVECDVPEISGALHIYSPDQLRRPADPMEEGK